MLSKNMPHTKTSSYRVTIHRSNFSFFTAELILAPPRLTASSLGNIYLKVGSLMRLMLKHQKRLQSWVFLAL